MIEKVIEELKKDGWNIKNENNKLLIYKKDDMGNQNPHETFVCDEKGIYYFYQNIFCLLTSFDSLEQNFFGTFCLANEARGKVRMEYSTILKNLRNFPSKDTVNKIYESCFGVEYLRANLNLDSNLIKNNAFNLSLDNGWFCINYVVDDNILPITKVNDINKIYYQIFPFLMLKKFFDEDILKKFENYNIPSNRKLEFYNIYARGEYLELLDNKKKII